MKNRWKISSDYILGRKFYQVYRLRDINEVDHSGNREVWPKVFNTKEEAEAVAAGLNREEINEGTDQKY